MLRTNFKKLQHVFEVQSFGVDTRPQSFCHVFIALSTIRCLKSDQNFAVLLLLLWKPCSRF